MDLLDPFKVKDDVARGPPEIEHHGDYVRLVFWNDVGNRRYVIRRIVMATSDYVATVQALARPGALE